MEYKTYEKEGQMQGVVGSVIMLITGVGVATLILIFVGSLGGQTYQLVEADIDAIANNVVTSESFNITNVTAQVLHIDMQTGTLAITNVTQAIGLGNFTIDYDAGTVLLQGAEVYGAGGVANYTWGELAIRNSIKGGIVSGFEALEQTGDYMPIIVLAVVIALVLTLVIGMTNDGGQIGGGRGSAL